MDDGNLIGMTATPTTDFRTISTCLQELELDASVLLRVTRVGDQAKARNGKRILMLSFSDADSKNQFLDGFQQIPRAMRHNASYAREDLTVLQRQERFHTPSFSQPSSQMVNW